MTANRSKILTWIIVALVIVVVLVQLALWVSSLREPPILLDVVQKIITETLLPLAFVIPGIMILNQQPENKVGWFMMIVGLSAVAPYSTYIENLPNPPTVITPGLFLIVWFQNWSWILTILSLFLIPLYFPTGRLPSPRWNWVPRLAIFLWFFLALGIALEDKIGPVDGGWAALPNPIGFIPGEVLDGPIFMLFGLGLLTVVGASLVGLIGRYRKASREEKLQIKWLLYAGGLFAVSYGLTFFLNDPDTNEGWNSFWFLISILTIPFAIAIAILRYRLYDIDVIIRKTMVYAFLTAALGLVYFGSVVVLQIVIGQATDEQSPFVIVFSTLLIAALFSPLRRRIQSFIDRRFYRRKYDAAQTLAQFAQTARDEVDMDQLTIALLNAVQTTIQPVQFSLWLKTPKEIKPAKLKEPIS